jgi:hypothetical protein
MVLSRWHVLRADLEEGCPLVRVAAEHNVPERTLRRWLAAYRAGAWPRWRAGPGRTGDAGGCRPSCSC